MPRFRVNVNGWVYEGSHRLATDATLAAMRKWMQPQRHEPTDLRPENTWSFDEIAILCERLPDVKVPQGPAHQGPADERAAKRAAHTPVKSFAQPERKPRSRLESPPLDT